MDHGLDSLHRFLARIQAAIQLLERDKAALNLAETVMRGITEAVASLGEEVTAAQAPRSQIQVGLTADLIIKLNRGFRHQIILSKRMDIQWNCLGSGLDSNGGLLLSDAKTRAI
jgi:hypothetical protein